MIVLTRLNGKSFTLNAFLIEQMEELPDTTISLVTGNKIVVKEPIEVVQKRILDLYRFIGLISTQHLVKEDGTCSKAES